MPSYSSRQSPTARTLNRFLIESARKYERVFVIASAGRICCLAVSPRQPVAFVPMSLPEYETTGWEQFPQGPRQKDLGYSIYQLTMAPPAPQPFVLDVGYFDDLQTVRFFAREVTEGRSIRWTGPQSFISANGLTGHEHEIELVMHDGGRPAGAPPATIEVFFNGTSLGTVNVSFGFKSYRLAIPAEALRGVADADAPVQIRLLSSVLVAE
jgi:hypothetical protein